MNFRSTADLSATVRRQLFRIPRHVDLVVGIPRSGVLPASMIALALNRKLVDLGAFLSNQPISHGRTRVVPGGNPQMPMEARSILLVDDSIRTGISIESARKSILQTGFAGQVSTLAVYATPSATNKVDIFLESLPTPRVFEWNALHRPELADCCVDLDGVLCADPTDVENDDGGRYRQFLNEAAPLVIPSYEIGHIVTSRLERYRPETEEWLDRQAITYRRLHMLDAPDAETRRRLQLHARFKAAVYRAERETQLFIESDPNQAMEITSISGKPVLCFSTQQFFRPGLSWARADAASARFSTRVWRLAHRVRSRLIGQ